jgi:hypothetical protein
MPGRPHTGQPTLSYPHLSCTPLAHTQVGSAGGILDVSVHHLQAQHVYMKRCKVQVLIPELDIRSNAAQVGALLNKWGPLHASQVSPT